MSRLFGTDGVRGIYGEGLTDALARALGAAAATVLGRSHVPRVVIGRDTRASGPALEAALVEGIGAAGGAAILAGVIPTPAVSFLVRAHGADAGAVISASHNPARDNGIKLFGADGMKLADAIEDEIESACVSVASPAPAQAPAPVAFDPSAPLSADEERYLSFLLEGSARLEGLRVVVDCAHGAAYRVAPEAYRRAGARVTAIACAPDGENINDGCGSTHPDALRRAVLEHGAQIGIAHDGDADRVLALDERGELVDGDQILAICALEADERGALPGRSVVTTVMANLGFRRAMAREGIAVVESAVGDRYVLEAMRESGVVMGGEQSGHIIFLDRHTTGDGIFTALRLAGVLAAKGKAFSELAAVCPRMPQSLVAVRVRDRGALAGARSVWEAVHAVEHDLGDRGRVLVRPSGTEPVVRVMVEAPTEPEARAAAERVAQAVRAALS